MRLFASKGEGRPEPLKPARDNWCEKCARTMRYIDGRYECEWCTPEAAQARLQRKREKAVDDAWERNR